MSTIDTDPWDDLIQQEADELRETLVRLKRSADGAVVRSKGNTAQEKYRVIVMLKRAKAAVNGALDGLIERPPGVPE